MFWVKSVSRTGAGLKLGLVIGLNRWLELNWSNRQMKLRKMTRLFIVKIYYTIKSHWNLWSFFLELTYNQVPWIKKNYWSKIQLKTLFKALLIWKIYPFSNLQEKYMKNFSYNYPRKQNYSQSEQKSLKVT